MMVGLADRYTGEWNEMTQRVGLAARTCPTAIDAA